MRNNYDNIAPYYDLLSRMVFFRSQLKAQIDQLAFIPEGANVLIVGGGTGWILEEITKTQSIGLRITYVEISEKMLNLSKKREIKGNTITYFHSAAEDFITEQKFEVIITAFLFDNFSAEKTAIVFNKLNAMLKPSGFWLFCDFYDHTESGKKWQWYLLKAMYLFFNKISEVEAKVLINTEQYFSKHQYVPKKTAFYYSGFIKAIVYQK